MITQLSLEERKQNLIKALEKEKEGFEMFAHDTTDHEVTIKYLQTGKYDEYDFHVHDLLQSAVNDIECLFSDYGC